MTDVEELSTDTIGVTPQGRDWTEGYTEQWEYYEQPSCPECGDYARWRLRAVPGRRGRRGTVMTDAVDYWSLSDADTVRWALEQRLDAARALRSATDDLHDAIRQGRAGGARVRQLCEWSGYSERRVFQILKDQPNEEEGEG